MDILRTPAERFDALPKFPFRAHYVEVSDGLRMHFVDEGPRFAPVALLLHGEPSWSYLYRDFIPPLITQGIRVVVPDLIGFGKSDKPTRHDAHSYAQHVNWLQSFISRVGLTDITLFAQDWGGLLGLRVVARTPDLFSRLMLGNTALPTGDHPMGDGFDRWRAFAQSSPDFPIGKIIHKGTVSGLTPAEIAAYNAPFPDELYKAGPRMMPRLVPVRPDDPGAHENRVAWNALHGFEKPVLLCFSDRDLILGHYAKVFKRRIRGCVGQDHFTTPQAGHFLQEDAAELLAQRLLAFMGR